MNTTPTRRAELRPYIRFQLSQLSVRNAAHEFEHLTFDLARARIASNFLPATGPVQAGGDQGRDFESFRSFLASSPLSSSIFSDRVRAGIIVGACTLNKQIESKIKSDLKTIFSFEVQPTHVAYFCEPDVPVAKRHALQQYCHETYRATLDIFDGQAIADMLSDRDTSWIADQYLEIPAELWPPGSLDGSYISARDRWLSRNQEPENYANFLEIRSGLRTATFQEDARRDLDGWIAAMRNFLKDGFSERIVQRVRYEIAVAELRGHGSLDPAISLVEAFFASLSATRPPAEILDGATLIVYIWGSRLRGQSSVSEEQFVPWLEQNDEVIESALAAANSQSDRCLLLEGHAMTAFISREGDCAPDDQINRFFTRWDSVVDLVSKILPYPINHIADIFEEATAVIDADDRLRVLIEKVDALVAERAGKGAAADRSRRRAVRYLKEGRIVAAIDELHHAKADWFTGEHIEGSILAMLLLSQSYEALGLHYAARFYASAALFTALNVHSDRTSRYVSQAAFRTSVTFFAAGEGVTYVYSLGNALTAHSAVAENPHDWPRHPLVQQSVAQAAVFRAIAIHLAPEFVKLIDDAMGSWPISPEELDEFRAISEGDPWSAMTNDEITGKVAAELGQDLFSDIGDTRSAIWSAFGIIWRIRCGAEQDCWLAALELAAAMQIVQVEFADVDLLIIPSQVLIDVELSDASIPKCKQLPDNGRLAWKVSMSRGMPDHLTEKYEAYLIGVVIMVLGQASALPVPKLRELIESKMRRGLPGRVFSVRPLRELMSLVQPHNENLSALKLMVRPHLLRTLHPLEVDELRWRIGPGPGYSRAIAEEYLRNRYNTSTRSLRLTLSRINSDTRCRHLLLRMRMEGILDWQLLGAVASIVAQWQVEKKFGHETSSAGDVYSKRMSERIFREERTDDPAFDLDVLTEERLRLQLKIGIAASFRIWKLESHRHTPDLDAMKRLLDERYGHSSDDISHTDPFSEVVPMEP